VLGVGATGPLGGIPAPGAASSSERDALIVLACVEGIGPVTLARLIDRLGSAREVLATAAGRHGSARLVEASRDGGDWAAMDGPAAEALVAAVGDGRPERLLRGLERPDLRAVTLHDADYPSRLRAIDVPPHVLFLRGDAAALDQPASIAVVGTRRASEAGRRIAARIGAALSRAGAAVISGLAIGIDGAAHAAVVAEHGRTVGVLGGGHDRLYPPAHRRLAATIVSEGGAIVSELPPQIEPAAGTFPRRNRVISGLADAVVVVEAPARSGALLTAGWALAQGRGCYLVPGPLDSPQAAGCLSFLREYPNEARIVAGIPQLIEDLGIARLVDPLDPSRHLEPPVAAVILELGEGARRVAAAMVGGHTTADELVAATDLPIAAVLASITLLENRGLAVGAYGRYRPAGRLAAEPPR
jgi:DNA processing protein